MSSNIKVIILEKEGGWNCNKKWKLLKYEYREGEISYGRK